MVSFKCAHFMKDIILTRVRWHVAYLLSYRQVEELMEEHGVGLDHTTIHRWILKYRPQHEEAFHPRRRPVGRSWRMDETASSTCCWTLLRVTYSDDHESLNPYL